MDKESLILLQKIDCNCNDCKFMLRNNYKQQLCNAQVTAWHREDYDRNRDNALAVAYAFRDKVELAKLEKQKFQHAKSTLNYGYCKKFDFKEVAFIPATLQLETQACFQHRREA
jgi:hypothetical protein